MPAEITSRLRQYQLHQYQQDGFALRLVAASSLSEEFETWIRKAWNAVRPTDTAVLSVEVVDNIPHTGKFQSFTSVFM